MTTRKKIRAEAQLRRRAFYLHLPKETLRTIQARKAEAAIGSADGAQLPQETTREVSETLKSRP